MAGMGIDTPRRRAAGLVCTGILVLIAAAFLAPLVWLVLSCFDSSAQTSVKLPDASEHRQLPRRDDHRPGVAAAVERTAAVRRVGADHGGRSRRWRRIRCRGTSRASASRSCYTVLFATGLPITAIMVPVYGLFVRLQLIDSMPATAVFLATTSLPFAIWLIKGFIDNVPINLEEASWVDGATPMVALRHIVVPLIAPGMSVVLIFTFIQAWGNFFVPFILLQSPEKLPASVTVFTFFGQYGAVAYGQLAAYSVLYSMPVVVLYLIVSRAMGGAFRFAGAAKG